MNKIFILLCVILSVSFLIGCSVIKDSKRMTNEEVLNIIHEKGLSFTIREESYFEEMKANVLIGFLQDDETEVLKVYIFDNHQALSEAKKQDIKDRNNPNLDAVFFKNYYIENVRLSYLNSAIQRNLQGKYEKVLEQIVSEKNHTD